ncbi:hypothetical protein BUALT_Bualt04G0145500 [Buddleja alternifolia]|uniref:Ribosomal protein L34Ae n=1 Tax=Buddleja alternifolia TaxID=168488 RepID=A0AAV6XVD0_9LAMI|nr:hypothetical protein BUALT_Bualt04G0145500 [Buddleja alternifolia]
MASNNTLFSFVHSVFIYLLPLFRFISTYIFSTLKKNDEKIRVIETEHGLSPDYENDKDVTEFRDFDNDSEEEGIHLKFKFPTFEEFSRIQNGTGNNIINSEVVPFASTSKYEFTSGKSYISGFVEDLETYPVKQINSNFSVKGKEILVFDGEENEKSENIVHTEEEKVDTVLVEEEILDESKFEMNSTITDSDSDSESTSFEHIRSVMNSLVDSYSDGFLSDGDFGDVNEKTEEFNENHELSENFDDDEEANDVLEELKKLEENNNLQNPDELRPDFLSEKDFNEDLDNKYVTDNVNDEEDCEKTKESDCGDGNKLESLWEHQELIDQLQMELKKVRATGLPTILEESESPKIMDDLKPWKIDEKFQREDCMGELHKFYKSYRERMRKFDILNYQKMYAMGFLQLKDPLQSISKQKPSPPTLKSLVSQNLWLFKHKIHGSDPMKKFIKELEGDLEVVYVGQMCLSWEFLHWQYERALDLWDSDPRGIRRYNEVANEFQQFQVLMQRFIEDEPFQGPRVQNYVKSRCVLRNLVQVPVIREDNMKDKRKARKREGDEYAITSEMLVETVEESIRIFWRLVRADKDCAQAATNSNKKMPELHNPEDLKLLLEVKKNLQKKERKVKDLLRSENCILKKLRRNKEEDSDSDQVLYFFSQVDMKLVSRVLNMSKITSDQLMWCHNKLNRINFVNRKIYVEPAFLLFPC